MSDHQDEIVHRTMETETSVDPGIQIVEFVSHLEETEQDELPSLWSQIDHLIENLFSTPPAPEAQAEITFSYEGYRITVEQNGSTRLVPLE